MVLESAGLNATELSAYCRERGLYPEQVDRWRQAAPDGEPESDLQSTRTRTGNRCAPIDLASQMYSYPIFAEMDGYFSKLFEDCSHGNYASVDNYSIIIDARI